MTFALTQITWTLEPDVDIVKMYHRTKNEVSVSTDIKFIETDRQTDRQKQKHYENITSASYATSVCIQVSGEYTKCKAE